MIVLLNLYNFLILIFKFFHKKMSILLNFRNCYLDCSVWKNKGPMHAVSIFTLLR